MMERERKRKGDSAVDGLGWLGRCRRGAGKGEVRETAQPRRLGFNRAGGAMLRRNQDLLMASVTPRNRSFAGKTYMVRSLLTKVRKN